MARPGARDTIRSAELLSMLRSAATDWREALTHVQQALVAVLASESFEDAGANRQEYRHWQNEADAASVEYFAVLSEYHAALWSGRRDWDAIPDAQA
jgi:hypothetical protein